ncbi:iron-sulfur cluster assembly accessory protein [Coccidioides immitis RS]|uniref:Iron-sulfur cluster assembly accessory protein n=1 Tax=Coccidioides immitis (strain RS) TaxID=246410 RepID=J3KDB0_COCIM|nr:iron-sulfur cluster assembly accessory protein [Coccidioides immitis RS]EAS33330.3 iron-sulfur cluster assembly accessory protein [Coccidioides immitis RS]TPX21087.1 hypothetical protein DIZ76_015040 [Coccidioides immitis]
MPGITKIPSLGRPEERSSSSKTHQLHGTLVLDARLKVSCFASERGSSRTMSPPTLLSTGTRLVQCQNIPAATVSRHFQRLASSSSSRAGFKSSGVPSGTGRVSLSSSRWRAAQEFPIFPPHRRDNRTLLDRRLAFSTTALNHTTIVALNPRVDDDGNPMTIEISPRAAKRLRQLTDPSSKSSLNSKSEPYDHLRVTVTSGGCHGFQYIMSLDPRSKIDPEEDTVFEEETQDTPMEASSSPGLTSKTSAGEAKVVMDSASLELLKGSTIDYTVELIGSQFKVVNNPRATSSCGCGTSFDVTE